MRCLKRLQSSTSSHLVKLRWRVHLLQVCHSPYRCVALTCTMDGKQTASWQACISLPVENMPACCTISLLTLLCCALLCVAIVKASMKQQQANCISLHQADVDRALSGVVVETDRGQVITFTIEDHDRVMTVDEVGKISSATFQKLYSVSVHRCCLFAVCLHVSLLANICIYC